MGLRWFRVKGFVFGGNLVDQVYGSYAFIGVEGTWEYRVHDPSLRFIRSKEGTFIMLP